MAKEYKDSGIEWIGQIPKEWEVCKLKHWIQFVNGFAFDSNAFSYEKEIPVIRQSDISTPLDLTNSFKVDYDDKLEPYQVRKGDIVIGMSGSLGKICKISRDIDAYINQRVGIIRSDVNSYIYYLLQTKGFETHNDLQSFGTAILNISANSIGLFPIPFPPASEQRKIADYLDKVCGEVDEMVALQETMIEELKAYKQSVITEAVTKGLNPNVPMRDSGIDWIGEIPKHWGMPAIGYLAKIKSGSNPDRNNPLFWGEGTVNWIKTGELQNNRLSCSEEKVTEYALNNTSIKLYPKDTILMAMYGQGKTRGMTALLDVPCTTNQACAALSIFNKNVDVLFLWKCLMGAYDAIRDKAVGTGQPNLNIDLISRFVIPLPPYNEQVEIVAFIDEIIPQIDSLIALKQAKIEELKEYKKSVIYEYVTGKKEVV